MAAGELKSKLGISRLATVRNIARRITAAMAEPDASELLAGLDMHYAACPSDSPESRVLDHKLPEEDTQGAKELQDATETCGN